ncbi:hypothetical protein HYW82_03725 [Candidatus Peregrinibacteria bacterium]|nr:hypothetical protein [Candidatus Peregrinibacteria bacterium]
MAFQHDGLAGGRWFTFSLSQQLGNVGSEVERAIKWHAKGNKEYFESAYARMLELLDLTIGDERWKGVRRKELVRVREALCDSFEGGREIGGPLDNWPGYFLPFAILALRKPD